MNRARFVLAAGLCLSIVAAAAASAAPADGSEGRSEPDPRDRYIVVFEDWVGDPNGAAADHARGNGAEVTHVYRHALKGYAAKMSDQAAANVARRPNVAFVQPDQVVGITAQAVPTGINRSDADVSPSARINGVDERVNVDVAVIDTGLDLSHPDLNVYSAGAKNCVTPLLSGNDDHGHGTHVAGTIAALDNANGVVGIAPGARVWPVKVLSAAGTGLLSWIVCGIDFVTANASQIDVVNMSLGGGGSDDANCGNSNNDAEHKAICKSVGAGVTYVVAAGNDARDAKGSTPAAYDEVITVSALADFNGLPGGGAASTCRSDGDDTFASFSNYGADVDLIAPGVCIYSTHYLGGYATMSGTSMASPHVAGGAALYKAANPAASPAEVKTALQNAGTLDWIWTAAEDKDGVKEKLLNLSTF